MSALLTAIVVWLSANFGLPTDHNHPHVVFASRQVIADLRYREQPGVHVPSNHRREVVAIYDRSTNTIYLPLGWSGESAAELSVLVHEMVHHLQNRAGLTFVCPQEREELAYEAQSRWLQLFGTDLEKEFDLDRFTLLIVTRCMY